MATKLAPLSTQVPIVDKEGNPTPYFQQLMQILLTEKAATDGLAAGAVPQSRLINTTAPLSGGGDLSADRTLVHNNSAVTPGSYTNTNLTVDAKGHITAASNGTSGGGGTAPTVRSSKIQSSSASSYALTWPTGTVAGDIVLITGGHGFGFNNPSGWLVLDNSQGTNWNGAAWAKQMTATDITAGGVTVTTAGVFNGVIAQLTFQGVTGAIRETIVSRNGAGAASRSLVTDWLPTTTDMVIAFGSNRNNDSVTCNYGTQLQQIAAASASGVLNAASPSSNGAFTATFSYPVISGTTGDYQVLVVVKGS